LRSILVKVRKGAVPVFHSILSAEPIVGRHFRLNELAGSIPLVKYELSNLFGVRCQTIRVMDLVANDGFGVRLAYCEALKSKNVNKQV
jgi:hypothetical protein